MAGILDWMRRGAPDAELPELTDVPTSAVTPPDPVVDAPAPAAPRSSLVQVQAAPTPAPAPPPPLTSWRPPSPGQRAEPGASVIPERMIPAPTDEPTRPDVPLRQSTWRAEPKWIDVPGKGWLQFPGSMEDEAIGAAIRKNFPEMQQSVTGQIGSATVRGVTGTLATGLRGAGALGEGPTVWGNQYVPTADAYAGATPEERARMRQLVDQNLGASPAHRMALLSEFSDIDEGLAPRERRQPDFRTNAAARAGTAVEKYGQGFRLDPEQADRWYNQVAQGVGSTAAILATSVAGAPVGGMRIAGWVAAAATGAGEAADRALAAGVDESTLIRAAYSGLIPGAMDALAIDNLFRPIHANPGVRGALYAIAKKILEQAGVEGTTEGIQQVLQNAIARGLYRPNQPLTEDVVQNMLVGGAVGGIFGAGAAMPGIRRAPEAAPTTPAPGATPPAVPGAPPVAAAPPAPAAPTAPVAPGAPPGVAATAPVPAAPPAPQAAPAAAPAPAAPPPAPAAPVAPAPAPAPIPVPTGPTPAEQAAADLRGILADPRPAEQIAADEATARTAQLERAATDRGLAVDSQVRLTFEDGTDEGAVRRVYWSEDGEPSVTITRPITNSRGRADELRVYDGPIAGIGGVEPVRGDGSARSPRVVQTAQDVTAVAGQAQTPTPAQAEAGNYRLAHLKLHDMDIAIETPQGGTRTAKDGSWEVRNFPAHYGYVKAGVGADGDKIDVYVGPSPESQRVFAIDQIDPATGRFDEHKIMLGFPDEQSALNAYMDAFSDGSGPSRLGAVTGMSVRQFKSWMASEDTRKPISFEEPKPDVSFGTPEAPAIVPIAQAISREIAGGRVFKTIVQGRQFVRELLGGQPIPADSLKAIDEAIELAYVLRARDVAAEFGDDSAGAYQALTQLYLEQPNLTQTTSTSKRTQAFSTPLPLAYLASRLAQIDRSSLVFEPTAGNGALLMEATPGNVDANELQSGRASALVAQGFNVTSIDATNASWEPQTRDVVIMNPPFGKIPDGSRVDMGDGYVTNQIDHVIALRALEAMKPDGTAVMLLGSVSAINETGRAEAYRGRAKNEFFLRLRELYNVVDIFTVDGDLYSRQGAAWPVDVVVVRGRGASERALPSVDVPRVYSSWADLATLLDARYPERVTPAPAPQATAPAPKLKAPRPPRAPEPQSSAGEATDAVDTSQPGNVGAPAQPDAGGRDDGAVPGDQRLEGGLPAPDREQGGTRDAGPGRPGRSGGAPGQEAGSGGPAGGVPDRPAGGGSRPAAVPEPAAATGDQRGPEPGQGGEREESAGSQEAAGGERPVRVGGRPDNESGSGLNFDSLLDDVAGEGGEQPSSAPPPAPEAQVSAFIDAGNGRTVIVQPLPDGTTKVFVRDSSGQVLADSVVIFPKEESEDAPAYARAIASPRIALRKPKQTSAPQPPAKPAADSVDAAYDDLAAIFGEKQSREDEYERARPLLERVITPLLERGMSLAEAFKQMVRVVAERLKQTVQQIAARMRDVLVRFGRAVESGDITIPGFTPKAAPKAPATEKPAEKKPTPNEAVETKYQVAYQPRSGAAPVGTLAPVNMAGAMQAALSDLDSSVAAQGGIDAFVASELGYDVAELGQYFSAEQVDAIALAIKHIKGNAGFVIGDQTGIGKGRVNAAMIRWAVRNGRIPIFITEKPNLYADMLRDLGDIDSASFSPWITNSDMRGDTAVTFEGRKIETEASVKWRAKMAEIASTGVLPEGFDGVFTTYDQMRMKNGAPNDRTAMLGALASKAMLILDESHNAGGSGAPPQVSAKTGRLKMTVAQYLRRVIADAAGVFYSSATWAKRPDVMDLYSRTDLSLAAPSVEKLKEAFESGGVALQQIASSMLARAGQYMRRERSFDGVEFAAMPISVDRDVAENISTAMAAIADLDPLIEAIRKSVDKDVKAAGQAVGQDNAVGDAGATSTSFASMMHNVIDQGLLALSAGPVVQEAIAKSKSGEKIVIAVSNTMGSMIGEYAEAEGVLPGQPIDVSFRDLLLRYLERIRRLNVRRPFQRGSQTVYITDEMLGAQGRARFAAARNLIEGLNLDIPISPVDLIATELRRAGLKVGEVTGRTNTLDLSSPGTPTYKLRTEKERSKAQVNRTVQAFQNGDLDVVIINRSGATGLSMHADGKRAKDLRPRRMIIAQPEKNVDTFMQMLGRIHRTGQVVLPRYSLLIADVPSVFRIAAILMKKMRSLNANTTASARSHITDIDVPDFFNEYGDRIAAQLMTEEPDLWALLRHPKLKMGANGFSPDEAMAKVTGRIPLLPLAQQEEIYARLQDEYTGFMEQVEQMGLNALEAKTLNLDAKTVATVPFLAGIPGNSSPFAAPATFTQVDMKSLYRPPSGERVRADVAKSVDRPADADPATIRSSGEAQSEKYRDELRDGVREYSASLRDPDAEPGELTQRQRSVEAMHHRVDHLLSVAPAGTTIRLQTDEGNLYGVVVRVARRGTSKNPAAPGAWRWTVQTTQYRAEIPGSQLYGPDFHDAARDVPGAILIERVGRGQLPGDSATVYDLFDRMQVGGREKRWLITGNVFAGYVQQRAGQIINFTDSEGALRNGVLMSRTFNARAVAEATPVAMPSVDLAVEFLRSRNDVTLQTTDGAMDIQHDGGEWTFSVSKKRSVGGRYFLNDDILRAAFPSEFLGSRSDPKMTLKVDGDQGVSVLIAATRANSVQLEAGRHRDAAREFLRARGITTEAAGQERQSREPSVTLRREVREKADMAALRAELDRLNLQDVKLVEGAGAGAAGGFIDGLVPIIRIAMDRAKNPIGTLHHEALHAMRALGLFTRREWSILENMARQRWMKQFDIERRYPDLSEQAKLEEAIADGLRAAAENQAKGVVSRAIALAKKLVEATRNWMRGMGFTSSADVFNEILSGRVGARARIDQRGIATQERYALNPQTERAIDRVMRSGEPRPIRERLYDLWSDIRSINASAIYQGMVDGLTAIEKMERGITGGRLFDALISPYKKALAAQNIHAYLRTALQNGPLTYDRATGETGVAPGGRGLVKILSPLNTPERLKAFMGYAIGLRAERLMKEGRENLLTASEIQEFKDLANQPEFSDFRTIHQQWIEFNAGILDFAEAAGLINATQRQGWENSDYVPFYRVLSREGISGPTDKAGIEGQRSMIRRLRGGEEQINDLLENMVRNTAHLIDASLKNIAMQSVVQFAPGLGIMQRERMDWRTALVPAREAARRLAAAGVPMPSGNVPAQLLQMFSLVPPSDPDVVSVMINGKVQFYRVLDPALLASLKGFDHSQLRGLANILATPTAVLRRGVTLSPDFMARNAARDSLAAWALSGEKIAPFISSLRGFIKYYRDPAIVEEMRAQGISAGFYSRDPSTLSAMIRRDIEGVNTRGGVSRFVVHNIQRAWEAYQSLGEASEMMNRIAVYEAAKKRGASKAEAAYQARDLLNFWRSGGSSLARGFTYAYPFVNARIQGLDKMYRAFKTDPVRGSLYAGVKVSSFVLGRAMLLSALSIALAWWQKDDERYRELQDWDKNSYYHLFLPAGFKDMVGFDHLTFPKPFELGVLFSSIPERIYHAAFTDGLDVGGREWRNALKQAGKMIADNLSLGMIPMPTNSFADNVIGMAPQAIKPAVEVAANRSAFMQRPIEGQAMNNLQKGERDQPWTYDSARRFARLTEPVIGLSPVQVEHLVRGYLGTMSTYGMMAADALIDVFTDGPVKPSTPLDRRPVIGSFMRGDNPRDTKYLGELYETNAEIRQLAGTLRKLGSEGRKAEAEEKGAKGQAALDAKGAIESAVRQVSAISKKIRETYSDRTITDPGQKRRIIDGLIMERNRIAREQQVIIRDIDRARRSGP